MEFGCHKSLNNFIFVIVGLLYHIIIKNEPSSNKGLCSTLLTLNINFVTNL